MDIVDKIRKVAPSAVDTFAADIERRASLDSDAVTQILTKVFANIDVERLSPALWDGCTPNIT